MIGRRVEWSAQRLSPGEYVKLPDGTWYAETPNGHTANLAAHKVEEHEDGTISVSPSILVRECDAPGVGFVPYMEKRYEGQLWHGHLVRGVWSAV